MINARETRFCWTIENFDVAPHLNGQAIQSPAFTSDDVNYKNQQFCLLLYPRGSEKEDEGYISLFIKRLNDSAVENLLAWYFLTVVDVYGKCVKQILSRTAFCKGDVKGNNQLHERSLLLGSKRQTLLPDNKLTVLCSIQVVPSWSSERRSGKCISCLRFEPPNLRSLSRHFGELLESGIHSDLTIKAEGREFKVHKAILEARCPALMPYLTPTENSGVVDLPNLEAHVLQSILDFVYTGMYRSTVKCEAMFEAVNRCEVAPLKELLFPFSSSIRVRTTLECLRVLYEWTIRDFKNFSQESNGISYFLVSDNMPQSTWMKVSFAADRSDDTCKRGTLKFEKLQKFSSGAIHLKIKAQNARYELIPLKESENVFENGEFEIPIDVALDTVRVSTRGNLTLFFDIRVSTEVEQNSILEVNLNNINALIPDVTGNLRRLHYDMFYFYELMKEGDVTLNVGPDSLPAHKAVLCSRSEVFCKMFQHDTLESRTNSVDIKDVDKETMALVLMYIYSGDACMYENIVEKIIKTYSAADKYQLLPLKIKFREKLKHSINADNVGDILLLADTHSDECLKGHVYEFLTAHAGEVLQSERGLAALEDRGDLYRDTMMALLQHVSQQNQKD